MSTGERRGGTAVVAAAMAVAAGAGAVGFFAGWIDMGEPIMSRLPFGSAVVAGLALFVVVAVPMAVAAVLTWRGSPSADAALVGAGLLLVGWIAVEVLFIRTYAWLQPVCAAYGLLVAGLGWGHLRRHPIPGTRGVSPGPGGLRT